VALLLGLAWLANVEAQGPEPPLPPCPPECPRSPEGPHGLWLKSPEGYWVASEGYRPEMTPAGITPLQATGGPDEFGYTWDDSVSLSWVDATGGANTGMTGYGESTGPINIGFAFKYYENTYNQLFLTSSGTIGFVNESLGVRQGQIPSPELPNNVIAPYWSPMYFSGGGVYYLLGGTAPNRYFVAEWYHGNGYGGDDDYTFEVILYENGDILFQYWLMTYGSGWWCGQAGIEDSAGLDGLAYTDFCAQAPSYKAVLFDRPPPSARVQMHPTAQGRFTTPGATVSFEQTIRNTGELGADTYDLFTTTTWPAALYAADGVTPLTDTDSDGTVDTGPVAQGEAITITVQVTVPGGAVVGDNNALSLTARSSLNTSKSKTATLSVAIPAPFAQVFGDDADGAMSLYLVQPLARALKKVTSDWYWGYNGAVAEMPDSFAYFWTRWRSEGSVYVTEIEYTLLDRYGHTVRGVSKLTDHSGATVNTYDYAPAVAVAPNGNIGVLWYRYLYKSTDSTWNYNIYYAVLNAAGTVVVPPTNLTNNPIWGYGSAPVDVPRFWDPRIAATMDNRFVLAWKRAMNTADGSLDDIYYAVRDTSGAEVKPITRFTFDTPGSDEGYYDPNLASLSSNRGFLTWVRRADGDDDVYFAVLDSNGNIVKAATNLSIDEMAIDWSNPDAVQLSNGHVLVAWDAWGCFAGEWLPRIRFAVLDTSFNRIAGPTCLANPVATTGDRYASVAADNVSRGILTWMDYDWNNRRNLYYALVGGNGNVLTDPMIFRTSQATSPYIETSYYGYGNTSYSWTPPSDVDGLVALSASLFLVPPGGNAAIGVHYANHGATTATTVVLTATLDAALTYIGDTSGISPTVIGNEVTWNLPDLAFLEGGNFVLYVQVPSGAARGTRYPVTLTLSSTGPEANPADNVVAAEVVVSHQIFLPLIMKGW